MNEHFGRGPRRPIPQHGTPTESYNPGVVEYSLTPNEIEMIISGRGHLVPDGKQRGLVAPPPPIKERKVEQHKTETVKKDERSRKSGVKLLTADVLLEHIETKMTNKKIGEMYGISSATVTRLLKKYGLGSTPGKPRIFRGGRVGKAK